jgi:peptide/nickel transport system permease protein
MWRYVIKRLLLGALTILIITALIYILFAVLPGSFVSGLVNQKNQTPERKAQLLAYYGLDKPPLIRYFQWLWRLLHGDLDFAYSENEPVSSVIARVIWPTVILMGFSYIVTLLIAIPVGIISAVKQYSKLDTAVTAFSFFGFSLPNFWFGAILIALFAFPHGGHGALLPLGGIRAGNSTDYFGDIGDLASHLIMPTIVLVVQSVASYTRYVRSTMLDVLRMDYIRTARAKGLSGWTVVMRHAFRNSLLPLITLMALDIPQLFVGAVITETVFNWPGMGQKFVAAARDHDGAILVGILVILSSLVVVFNLLADILYTWADPRISYEGAK